MCSKCTKLFNTKKLLKQHITLVLEKNNMEEKPKKQNDHENENQLLNERIVLKILKNETNDNRILDTEIITPSDYKFEHGTVKKEVKEEESEETKIEITSEYEYTDDNDEEWNNSNGIRVRSWNMKKRKKKIIRN